MPWELPLIFFGVALLYSSVGFGGGSSYLALLASWNLPYLALRPLALLCNLVVVSGNLFLWSQNGLLKWRKVLPLVACSVPFAFWGGTIRLSQAVFFIVLSSVLLLAGLLVLIRKSKSEGEEGKNTHWSLNALLGSGIGFLSGLVGIGGGIFLAPMLHLLHWDRPRVIAATASAFIFANSAAGLGGQLASANALFDPKLTLALLVAVALGGQLGSRLSLRWLTPGTVRVITALLVIFVAIRLLIKFL